MAKPVTRTEFKQYCLRKLGEPVIQINVADEQVEDRIDEALSKFADYHFNGTERQYYKHQVTQQDLDNEYITLPENIIGAVSVFPIGSYTQSDDMFNIQYQIALNDLYTFSSVSMVPYYMTMQHLALIEQMLVGQQPIRFNRHNNQLHIDMKWKSKIRVGQYIVVEAYEVVDPDEWVDVWSDRWLQNYATALIKKQWGDNLTKYVNAQLPGGIALNGQGILSEAIRDLQELDASLISSYQALPLDLVG